MELLSHDGEIEAVSICTHVRPPDRFVGRVCHGHDHQKFQSS